MREPVARRSCSLLMASCVLIPKWDAKSSSRTTLEVCGHREESFNNVATTNEYIYMPHRNGDVVIQSGADLIGFKFVFLNPFLKWDL